MGAASAYDTDDERIYSHSLPGRKINALRSHPRACLQVDEMTDDLHWRSVIAFGNFEEIDDNLEFDWKIGIGLISSFAARETIISTLSIVYDVGETSDNKSSSLVGAMQNAKRPDGSPVWTPLVGISLMLFFLLACQCMSTVAIVRRETNSWRWPLLMVGYMLVLAYLASFVTYQGGRLLGCS